MACPLRHVLSSVDGKATLALFVGYLGVLHARDLRCWWPLVEMIDELFELVVGALRFAFDLSHRLSITCGNWCYQSSLSGREHFAQIP